MNLFWKDAKKMWILGLMMIKLQISCNIMLYSYRILPTPFYECIKQGGTLKMATALFSRLPNGFQDGQVQNIINMKSAGLST